MGKVDTSVIGTKYNKGPRRSNTLAPGAGIQGLLGGGGGS